LDKPQSVLFVIGFSFQDKHIAKMVKRAIQNPELIVYVFGFTDGDRQTFLDNLNFENERPNFRILTPRDFDEAYINKHTEDINDEKWFSFTLSNLTNILNGIKLEESKDDNA